MTKTKIISLTIAVTTLTALAIVGVVGIARPTRATVVTETNTPPIVPMLAASAGEGDAVWRGTIEAITYEGTVARDGTRLVLIRRDQGGAVEGVYVGPGRGLSWAWTPAIGARVVVIEPRFESGATLVIPERDAPEIVAALGNE